MMRAISFFLTIFFFCDCIYSAPSKGDLFSEIIKSPENTTQIKSLINKYTLTQVKEFCDLKSACNFKKYADFAECKANRNIECPVALVESKLQMKGVTKQRAITEGLTDTNVYMLSLKDEKTSETPFYILKTSSGTVESYNHLLKDIKSELSLYKVFSKIKGQRIGLKNIFLATPSMVYSWKHKGLPFLGVFSTIAIGQSLLSFYVPERFMTSLEKSKNFSIMFRRASRALANFNLSFRESDFSGNISPQETILYREAMDYDLHSLKSLVKFLKKNQENSPQIKHLEDLIQKVKSLSKKTELRSFAHGDAHMGNIFIGAKKVTFIDYETTQWFKNLQGLLGADLGRLFGSVVWYSYKTISDDSRHQKKRKMFMKEYLIPLLRKSFQVYWEEVKKYKKIDKEDLLASVGFHMHRFIIPEVFSEDERKKSVKEILELMSQAYLSLGVPKKL